MIYLENIVGVIKNIGGGTLKNWLNPSCGEVVRTVLISAKGDLPKELFATVPDKIRLNFPVFDVCTAIDEKNYHRFACNDVNELW